MNKKINFSIIIPAKNEEKRLPQCLYAIKKCTLGQHEVEIIVIDNGSVDKTVKIATDFQATVIKIPDSPISKLRNIGSSILEEMFSYSSMQML